MCSQVLPNFNRNLGDGLLKETTKCVQHNDNIWEWKFYDMSEEEGEKRYPGV